MSADHRKPVVAFVVLAFLAAALVGIQRADARGAQFVASILGVTGRVQGTLPHGSGWTVPSDNTAVAQRWIASIAHSASAVAAEPAVAFTRASAPETRDVAAEKPARSPHGPADARRSRAADKRLDRALRRTTSSERARGVGPRSVARADRAAARMRRDADRGARGRQPSAKGVSKAAEHVHRDVRRVGR